MWSRTTLNPSPRTHQMSVLWVRWALCKCIPCNRGLQWETTWMGHPTSQRMTRAQPQRTQLKTDAPVHCFCRPLRVLSKKAFPSKFKFLQSASYSKYESIWYFQHLHVRRLSLQPFQSAFFRVMLAVNLIPKCFEIIFTTDGRQLNSIFQVGMNTRESWGIWEA